MRSVLIRRVEGAWQDKPGPVMGLDCLLWWQRRAGCPVGSCLNPWKGTENNYEQNLKEKL